MNNIKENDIVICKKDFNFNNEELSFKKNNKYTVFILNEYNIIILSKGKIVFTQTFTLKEFKKHFYTLQEYRKLKINHLNEI